MIVFRRIEDKVFIAKDKYDPSFIFEYFTICPDVVKLVQQEKWDALFVIMMLVCPDQVRVELELAEDAFKNLVDLKPSLAPKIKNLLDYKWIESEKARRDLGGAALVDWFFKYDN